MRSSVTRFVRRCASGPRAGRARGPARPAPAPRAPAGRAASLDPARHGGRAPLRPRRILGPRGRGADAAPRRARRPRPALPPRLPAGRLDVALHPGDPLVEVAEGHPLRAASRISPARTPPRARRPAPGGDRPAVPGPPRGSRRTPPRRWTRRGSRRSPWPTTGARTTSTRGSGSPAGSRGWCTRSAPAPRPAASRQRPRSRRPLHRPARRGRAPAVGSGRFFLWVHLFGAHGPHRPTPRGRRSPATKRRSTRSIATSAISSRRSPRSGAARTRSSSSPEITARSWTPRATASTG